MGRVSHKAVPARTNTNDTMEEQNCHEKAINEFRQIFQNAPQMLPEQGDVDPIVLASLCDTAQPAFSAYKDPTVTGLLQRIVSKPLESAKLQTLHSEKQKVRYVNYEYMKQTVKGVLKIHLQRAENVERSDGLLWFEEESDPYVIFSVGSHYVQSEIVRNNANPVWNSTHYLVIPKEHVKSNVDSQKMRVSLLDDDWETKSLVSFLAADVMRDDLLGVYEMDLDALMSSGKQSHQIKIQHRQGSDSTTLVFTTEFVNFESAYREIAEMYRNDTESLESGSIEEGADWMYRPNDGEGAQSPFSCERWGEAWGRVPLDPLVFLWVRETDTQVWVCLNRDTKSLVVSFRGTELDQGSPQANQIAATQMLKTVGHKPPSSLADVITDLKFSLRSIDVMAGDDYILRPTATLDNAKIEVHNGFLQAYASVRESLMQVLYDITQWSPEWTICMTGHSLGGALATLCAYELANRRNSDGQCPAIKMISYGAPRVGNRAFVESYNDTVRESYRSVEFDDPVPTLPFELLGYRHVSTKVLFRDGRAVMDARPSLYRPSKGSQIETLQSALSSHSQNLLKLVRKFALFNPCVCTELPDETGLPAQGSNTIHFSTREVQSLPVRKKEETGFQSLIDKHMQHNYFKQLHSAAESIFSIKGPVLKLSEE